MTCYGYRGFCLFPIDGAPPPDGAVPCEPFAPLVFVVRRDPLRSRGVFAVNHVGELFEGEGPQLLLPPAETDAALPDSVRAIVEQCGAAALNTEFSRAFEVLAALSAPPARPVITIVGLGDVGATTLLGMKLLGAELSRF
ncbi:MAG: hypothetical protein Q4B99_04485 [Clostridia bacterium]|nr:hypothetical protein [Clostridia bacterium]